MKEEVFLGVENSFRGRAWHLKPYDARLAEALSQRYDLPELLGRVLASRNIGLDQAGIFLSPSLKEQLPDPFHLLDMEKAAIRLADAVQKDEIIGIFGDYDVDGATSSALLQRFFQAIGSKILVHIPDRMKEGYGPNAPAMLAMQSKGAKIVVTVDCGINAFEALAEVKKAGLEVIIVDHHAGGPSLPEAIAIVNPNRLDETSQHGHMAAVGIAFLLVVAVNRKLRERGWYNSLGNIGENGPDLLQWLDVVALGTICDVVPLSGVNRALVAQGIKVMAMRTNAGIAALADIASVSERLEAFHAGYILGPRINAGGRVGQASLGLHLLTCDDPDEVRGMALRLDQFNRERQDIEGQMLLSAMEQVESRPLDNSPVIMVSGDGWHPGVIGIIASRLKERYSRPVCVVAFDGVEGKGSGRSVQGFDLGAIVIAAHQAGLLIKGGGHSMAAGFTIHRDYFEKFYRFVTDHLIRQKTGDKHPVFMIDGLIDVVGANIELLDSLKKMSPYGSGNPEPHFAITQAKISRAKIIGSGHISCTLSGRNGGWLKAIAFRVADSELGQALLTSANDGTRLHLAGNLRINSWQGTRTAQFIIEDAATC